MIQKMLLTVLSSCMLLSGTVVNTSRDTALENNFDNETVEISSSVEEAGTYANERTFSIRALVNGFLQTFVITLFGGDILADAVRDYIWNNWKTTNYTYTYTEDDGCWSPEFPNNPFCRIRTE